MQERKLYITVILVNTSIQKIKTVCYRYIGNLNKVKHTATGIRVTLNKTFGKLKGILVKWWVGGTWHWK